MGNHFVEAIGIFSIVYLLIISEKFNRTSIAMFGAMLMLILNIETQNNAIEHIDFNTIGILIGMMITVIILKKTGIFEYTAIKIAKAANKNLFKLVFSLSLVTAISSALLDNVTTILLIVPVTLVLSETLEVNPIPMLIPEVLAANIGGTATLIGDPPNIMIGSSANISFIDFLINLTPVVIIIFVVTFLLLKMIFKSDFTVSKDKFKRIDVMDEKLAIKDEKLLRKSTFVMLAVITGFMLHSILGYDSSTVALSGAAVLLLWSGLDPEEIFLEIEWNTIFFFTSLFILVGALEDVGFLKIIAEKILSLTHGNLAFTTMLILWVSAIASAFLDNIPFVATMIPLITDMSTMGQMNATPLWWALSLGACLGGNGTLVGASANVIVSGMLEKKGITLKFFDYMKVAFPLMLVSIAISSVYIFTFYL